MENNLSPTLLTRTIHETSKAQTFLCVFSFSDVFFFPQMILLFYLDNIMYLSLETIMFEPQNDKTSSKYFNAATYSEFELKILS